jgi:putative ubiquitin-RnfH superfamily antitoxin RatB of RatAB toxin-antitoxin module
MPELIRVEVAYALPDEQWIVALTLRVGSTVQQAIEQSGLLERVPGTGLSGPAAGIFGKVVPLTRKLEEGDRVELYRPLATDPKQTRRHRAELARKAGARHPKQDKD